MIRRGVIRTVGAGFIGLFVDDGSLAVAVLAWLGVCRLALPWLGLAPAWPPLLLSAGLVALLAYSATRRAGQR